MDAKVALNVNTVQKYIQTQIAMERKNISRLIKVKHTDIREKIKFKDVVRYILKMK